MQSVKLNRVYYINVLKKTPLETKLEKPIKLDSAKGANYKISKTFTILTRYKKGNRKHSLPTKGRTHSKYYSVYSGKLSGLSIVKKRVIKKFVNCKVIGGYKLIVHGHYNYYELVLSPY
jgi:ribosomal protein L15E